MLTVALPKGALLKESIELFKTIGLDFSAFLDKGNRQLQIPDPGTEDLKDFTGSDLGNNLYLENMDNVVNPLSDLSA